MARSAVRIEDGEIATYKCDDGRLIKHDINDGAVALAHKLLDTIHEVGHGDE